MENRGPYGDKRIFDALFFHFVRAIPFDLGVLKNDKSRLKVPNEWTPFVPDFLEIAIIFGRKNPVDRTQSKIDL